MPQEPKDKAPEAPKPATGTNPPKPTDDTGTNPPKPGLGD